METVKIIFGSLIAAAIGVIIFLVILQYVVEKLTIYRKEKKEEALRNLKVNDEIIINHNLYDNKAVFKAIVDDVIHVIAYENGVPKKWAIINRVHFIKKA